MLHFTSELSPAVVQSSLLVQSRLQRDEDAKGE